MYITTSTHWPCSYGAIKVYSYLQTVHLKAHKVVLVVILVISSRKREVNFRICTSDHMGAISTCSSLVLLLF